MRITDAATRLASMVGSATLPAEPEADRATRKSMDSDKYRNVVRHQAGAVTIIAVGTPGQRTGLTATAVCSLTDSPPMVIACVNRNASAHAPIHSGQCFSINLLANDQN